MTILQDLIAGGIAGSCSVFIGHPFDTYKVMLQTSTQSVQKRSLSISRLYRGIMPPLASAGAVNAIIFGSFGGSSRLWDEYVSQDKVCCCMNFRGIRSLSNVSSTERNRFDSVRFYRWLINSASRFMRCLYFNHWLTHPLQHKQSTTLETKELKFQISPHGKSHSFVVPLQEQSNHLLFPQLSISNAGFR